MIKELEKEFIGRGEVKGFEFTQLIANSHAFLYKVTDTFGNVNYEVFQRIVNHKFNCVSYPKSKSFGLWAWSFLSHEAAIERFYSI